MKYLIILLLFILISGCSTNFNYQNTKTKLNAINKIMEISLNFPPDKALYNTDTLVLSYQNYIYIYKNKKLRNKFGGMGSLNTNFSEISDFTITNSEKIIILDGLQKELKIFDINGGWIDTVSLEDFNYPKLFDFSNAGNYFIYDYQAKKVSIINSDDKTNFSFDVDLFNPTILSYSNTNIILSNLTESNLYTDLGQFIKSFSGEIQINRKNIYTNHKYYISNDQTEKKIYTSLSPIRKFYINNDFVTIISADNKVTVLQLRYE